MGSTAAYWPSRSDAESKAQYFERPSPLNMGRRAILNRVDAMFHNFCRVLLLLASSIVVVVVQSPPVPSSFVIVLPKKGVRR